MKCAWIAPRRPIPISIKKMANEIRELMSAYYTTGQEYVKACSDVANND